MKLVGAEATRELGTRLGGIVQGGDSIALIGDLGAGKTTLVTGLVAALGAGTAASPTFSLVNEYTGGRLIVWHVDLYRIDREVELIELGLRDMLGDRRGVCVVEWADKFAVMPKDHLRIELTHDGDARVMTATGQGPRGEQLAKLLQQAG